jgi:hypothetical protein
VRFILHENADALLDDLRKAFRTLFLRNAQHS